MDRDDLIDLFSEFGPIDIRRMFNGYGIVADGVNFAMSLRARLIFRVDDLTAARYDAEGLKPFQYQTRNKTVVVKSYRHIPERLYDDPEELAVWAREAVGAAQRAKAGKAAKRETAKTRHHSRSPVPRRKQKPPDRHRAKAPELRRKKYQASGDLDLAGRRIFRVGLADDAVAAIAFGGIEAGISPLDQGLGVVASLQHRDADRHCHPAKDFAG